MQVQPIQIILFIIFGAAIIRTILRFRVGKLKASELVLWLAIWGGALIFSVMPNASFYFARLFGVGRGADLVVYLALVILFLLVFKVISKQETLEANITKLVRSAAIQDQDKE